MACPDALKHFCRGIYFRSLHLGNIVLTPEGSLGLIDIADLSFQRRPLSKAKARRNLAHFTRLLENLGLANSWRAALVWSPWIKRPPGWQP